MKITNVMTHAAVLQDHGESLVDAAKRMCEEKTGYLLVLEGDGMLGIITERDILQAVADGKPLDATKVKDVMKTDVVTAHASTTLREAAKLMTEHWIRHLPVVDGGKLVGVISQRDLAGVLSGALNEADALNRLIEASEHAREERLHRIEKGAWD